ncbi:Retrovirus-related Pol polyprotein from transposon [Trichinella zimbabwensis]|uniref:RNA-directed DNA polymerase n=1 Tax=Trichinella zimbabwensis TaxID=268475 RepID=A0A0V1H3N6_9BILA|nr:Retrovirus-related Pol polyprotein from transposon [Trichinella zimbabwensis]
MNSASSSDVNFYRRFIPRAATLLAPLEKLTSSHGTHKKLKLPEDAVKAFIEVKEALVNATLLSHPKDGAALSLVVDASDHAADEGRWSPLAFFSSRFQPRRQFTVLTDHKLIVQAVQRGTGSHNPREVRQLGYITSFTSDVRHIKGAENAVADLLSRASVGSLSVVLDSANVQQLAGAQQTDPELSDVRRSSSLLLRRIKLHGTDVVLWCDTSHGKTRPTNPQPLRGKVFTTLHGLSHPSIRGSRRLVLQNYVWPGMNKDVARWTGSCQTCQRTKVHQHTKTLLEVFTVPDSRFDHVHLDIDGPLPTSR